MRQSLLCRVLLLLDKLAKHLQTHRAQKSPTRWQLGNPLSSRFATQLRYAPERFPRTSVASLLNIRDMQRFRLAAPATASRAARAIHRTSLL